MRSEITSPDQIFGTASFSGRGIVYLLGTCRTLVLCFALLGLQVLLAQMPRPLFGLKYDLNGKATYNGFDSTVYRQGFYAPGTFSLDSGQPRNRSRVGIVMLAPVGQVTLWGDDDDNESSFLWPDREEGYGRGYDGTGVGVGVDLESALIYDRANGKTYDTFDENTGADLNFTELNHIGPGDPLKYQVWLNFDYLELSSCARFNVWLFHGKKSNDADDESLSGALDFLFEPIQFHFDYGFGVAMPVSKYGVYYMSNDPTPGIDEQVTQNMNDVLQPTTVLSRIMGVGLRVGRLDFTYRWRVVRSDALRTLGNSYGFREWSNAMIGTSSKNNAIREVGITMYLFGGGPRKKDS